MSTFKTFRIPFPSRVTRGGEQRIWPQQVESSHSDFQAIAQDAAEQLSDLKAGDLLVILDSAERSIWVERVGSSETVTRTEVKFA